MRGYTWWCSGTIFGSTLRSYCRQCSYDHMGCQGPNSGLLVPRKCLFHCTISWNTNHSFLHYNISFIRTQTLSGIILKKQKSSVSFIWWLNKLSKLPWKYCNFWACYLASSGYLTIVLLTEGTSEYLLTKQTWLLSSFFISVASLQCRKGKKMYALFTVFMTHPKTLRLIVKKSKLEFRSSNSFQNSLQTAFFSCSLWKITLGHTFDKRAFILS